ncbi:MAG TPA: NAD(P)H-dependent oxidoreductase [Sphingomonas sp.]
MSGQPAFYRPRHAVILAHPNPHSFDALVADNYCDAVRACGQEAIVRDLYALGFDPLLKSGERPGKPDFAISRDVEAELDVLRSSDVFVFVYPIWFGMPPAMMKGYVDRVLGAGVTARQVQDRSAVTLMRGKRLVSITSSGASKYWLNEERQMDSLRNVFGRYLLHAFGLKDYEDLHFGETVEGLSQDFVDENMAQVRDRARAICAAVAGKPA